MKRPRPSLSPHDETIQAMAAAWLAQRDDGLTAEEQAEFARWRAADPAHEAAVARLERAWTGLQQLKNFRPEARVHPDRDLLANSRRQANVIAFPAWATAAALAACVALVAIWWWPRSASSARGVAPVGVDAAQEFATTAGGYQRTVLADGSIVELNASSAVRVVYSADERRVQLVRGEASFTVAKNPHRPFWVVAGKVGVRAVGTAFNVRLGAAEVEVLVTEGRVEVSPHTGASIVNAGVEAEAGAAPEVGAFVPQAMNAWQRLVIPVAMPAVAAATPVSIEPQSLSPAMVRESLAWQGPRLVFVDTPLAEVVAQFNRRNQVQLELGDAELGALPVAGSFKAEHVDAFVRLITSDGEIVVERPTPDHLVLRKAK